MHEGKMSKPFFAVRIHEAFTRYQVLKNEKEIFFVSPSCDTNCHLTGTVHGRKSLKDFKNVEWIKKAAKQSKPETLHIIIKIYVCLRRKTEYFRFHCTISLPNQFELLVSGRPGWNSILVENFVNHYVTESLFTKVDLSSLHVLHYANSAWYVVLILPLSVVMRIQE